MMDIKMVKDNVKLKLFQEVSFSSDNFQRNFMRKLKSMRAENFLSFKKKIIVLEVNYQIHSNRKHVLLSYFEKLS